MIQPAHNAAMVLAHGNHEVFLSGMIRQYQPHILYITCGSDAKNDWTKKQARAVLQTLALQSTVTFLPVTETEIYRHMLLGDMDWFEQFRDQVAQWLDEVRPDVIFTDAFEWYNSVHDLCSLLVDSAFQATRSRSSRRPDRHDLPLAFQTIPNLHAREFDDRENPFRCCSLTHDQSLQKRAIVKSLAVHDANIRAVTAGWKTERYELEVYRPVPLRRDYRIAPRRNAWMTYDEHGKQNVSRGRYTQAISFREHFAPIAAALFGQVSLGRRDTMSDAA